MAAQVRKPRDRQPRDRGVALVLVLLVVALLYIVIAELVTTSEFDEMEADRTVIAADIHQSLKMALAQVIQDLKDDLESGSAEGQAGAAAGAAGGAAGGALPGLGGQNPPGLGSQAPGGQEEPDVSDSSRDPWYAPHSYFDDNKITVYGWVEDENRKLNILGLLSEDEEFRQATKDRMVRLFDEMWEDSDFDVTRGDADAWVNAIQEWLEARGRDDMIPRPPLKSDVEDRDFSLPLTLEELKLLPRIPEGVFDDRIQGERVFPGLSSVLTVHTALAVDPGEEQNSTNGAQAPNPGNPLSGNQAGQQGRSQPGRSQSGQSQSGQGQSGQSQSGQRQSGNPLSQTQGSAGTLLGPGVRININTASPAVLYALAGEANIPRTVIDALLRYRNEIDEEAMNAERDEEAQLNDLTTSDYEGDEQEKYKIFKTVDDLDEVPEWKSWPPGPGKDRFLAMLTTQSNVFTVHLAAIYKRDSEGRAFTLTHARMTLVRLEGSEEAEVQTILPLQEVDEFRVKIDDFPEEFDQTQTNNLDYADPFLADEKAWNPFLIDFYDPRKRENRQR